MHNYQTYRLHFEPGHSIEELRDTFASLVILLYSAGAWPETIYRTANSKLKALQNPIHLSDQHAVASEFKKSITLDRWGEVRTKRYWAPEAIDSDRFVFDFGSNFRAFKWGVTVIIEHSLDKRENFMLAIDNFSGVCKIGFAVLILDRERSSEIVGARLPMGKWIEVLSSGTELPPEIEAIYA